MNQNNVPLNDNTDYGLCFACGPRNSSGLQLKFTKHDNKVKTTYSAQPENQGFPGYIHGGIIYTVLDEVMSRVSVLENRWTVTAKLEVRYLKPIPINTEITAYGKKKSSKHGLWETEGWIELKNGIVAAKATGLFAKIENSDLLSMSQDYPILSENWIKS